MLLFCTISLEIKDSIYLFPHHGAGLFFNMAFLIPKGIIVHSMGEFIKLPEGPIYAKDFLISQKLSVHGFIKPNGDYDKMLPSKVRAHHAGMSLHEGISNLNKCYLGFELLVKGTHDWASFIKAIKNKNAYTERQFQKAIMMCKYWMKEYDIPAHRVVRHSDVSGDDVRGAKRGKIDPGSGFDWDEFKNTIS